MPPSRRHILLVEAHRDIRTAFVSLFETLGGYTLHLAEQTREALGIIGRGTVDLAVVDLSEPAEFAERLSMIQSWRTDGRTFPVIVTSAQDYLGLSNEALEAGADDFLRKPYLFGEMRARIKRQLERRLDTPPTNARVDGIALPHRPFDFAGATITPDLLIRFPNGFTSTLTAKQLGILSELRAHAGTLLLKEKLVYSVWGVDANVNSASVHQYIHVLRKLYRDGGIDLRSFITPENKVGWRIAANPAGNSHL